MLFSKKRVAEFAVWRNLRPEMIAAGAIPYRTPLARKDYKELVERYRNEVAADKPK